MDLFELISILSIYYGKTISVPPNVVNRCKSIHLNLFYYIKTISSNSSYVRLRIPVYYYDFFCVHVFMSVNGIHPPVVHMISFRNLLGISDIYDLISWFYTHYSTYFFQCTGNNKFVICTVYIIFGHQLESFDFTSTELV